MEKKFDVFISHSSKDGLAASAIKQHLQSCGIRCWKAPDDIMPGESWPQAILRAIGNSRAMVLVWSTNSTTSGEVSKELTLAMRNNLTVVPFRIENVSASGEWEYHLANTHWMDAFSGKIEQHLDGLRDYLQKILPPTNKIFNSLHNKQSNTPKKKRKIIIFAVIILALLLLISGVYLNSKIGEKIISPVENKKPPVDISHLNNPSGGSQLPPPQTAATPTVTSKSIVEYQPSQSVEPRPNASSSTQVLQQGSEIALQTPQLPSSPPPVTTYQPPSASNSTIASPWLFPDSSQRILTAHELSVLSQEDLWRARNELFARRGYIFKTAKGKALAASLGNAYSPLSTNQDTILVQMNPVEKANVKAIQQFEKK